MCKRITFILPTTHGLQDKIVRYERYIENSFVSLLLTYGKCIDIVIRGVPREKRHLKECLTLAPYTLPYLLTRRGLQRPERIVTSPQSYHKSNQTGSIYEYS